MAINGTQPPGAEFLRDELKSQRVRILDIDKILVGLFYKVVETLGERQQVVEAVNGLKIQMDEEVLQPGRFEEVVKSAQNHAAPFGLDPQLVTDIWDVIHVHSIRQQEASRQVAASALDEQVSIELTP